MLSDLQPIGGFDYPAGVAIVDACAGGCVNGSEGNAAKNTCNPGAVENCLLSKTISAEGRKSRGQRAMYSTAARVICTVVSAVMELRMYCQRCYVRYVLRTAVSTAAQRATYEVYVYLVRNTVCSLQQKNV